MADNGGSSRGGGRGGRGGGSTRGGGARSRRGRGGSSRQQGGPTASTTGGGRGGGGGNNTPVHRAIGDETTDKIGREVSELVMSSRPDDCSKLEALLAQTHKQHPKRLQTVLHRNTTFSFPQGHMLAAACSNGKVAAADLLLRYGVEPNKQCPSGSTALSLACYNGRTACVKLLLGLPGSLRGPAVAGVGVPSRASPRVAPAYGANALIHACRCTNEKAAEEIVGALLEADPSLPLEAAEGALALHAAAVSGFPRVLERLLKSNDQLPDDQCETQLGWINNDNLCALQVAEKKCETEMQREREKQAQASRAPRPQGGGGGQQQQQQQQRRGANNGGGSRGGRGRRNGARGRGGGGNSSAGRGGGDGGSGGQSQGGSVDGAASEGGESRDDGGDGDSAGAPRQSPPGGPAGWQEGEVLEGGWGCVVVLVRASGNGIRNALHGSLSLKTDVVRDRLLSFLGLNALVKDIRKQRDEVEKAGGNADVADDFSDYTMSVLTHVSAMYKAVLKLPRSALQGPQQSTTSRLLVELIRPRDGLPRAVDDISCLVLLEILVNSTATPQVVRPLVLLLTEMANAPLPSGFSVDAGRASMIESSLPEWDSRVFPCCVLHRKEPTVPRNGPGFHFQACLDVWQNVCTCIARLGKMLLYGLQGQQEGEHGEVLYEREGLLFDNLWELVFRFLVPHADEVACFLADHDAGKGKSPTSSILKVVGSAFPSLWTGLSEALSVVEGDVGGTEPDRFGALLRGYLAYLHLADDSEEHYKAIVKVVKENGVDTGLASSAAAAGGDSGGGSGVRRGGRGQSAGRNPRNILTAIAAETELGIPEAFRELVVEQSDAVEEILDADPAVLENRLSVLLRIEGAVETPQKLDYIASALEARAGRSGKGLELCVNRMAEPHEIVEVTMQQLAAAPPRAMAPHPELKFVNEQGQGDGPMRELLDLLSEVFNPERTITVSGAGGGSSASDTSASATTASGPSPGGGASGGGAAGGRSTGRSTLNPAAAVFVKPGPGGAEARAGAAGASSLPSPPVSADMARLAAAFLAAAPDDYEVPRSGGGGAAAMPSSRGAAATAPPPGVDRLTNASREADESEPWRSRGVRRIVMLSHEGGGGGGNDGGGSGRRPGGGAGGPTAAPPPATPGETSTQIREEAARDRSRKVSEVAGFWKQFPLFRRYEPDPAAVVPRAAGEAGVNSANDREGMESRLRFFRAAGRIIAMSVVSGSPLGVVMPEAVWSVLLGSTPTWEDCCGRDTQYLESMRKVLAHEFGKGEGGNGMELYFSVSERGIDGKVTDVPLLAGGENKRVTDKNKQEFVNLATRRRALGGAEKAVAALRSGMTDVIPKNLLSILLPPEVASIVSGPQGEVNLSELRTNVWYVESDGGFGCSHKSIRWFWEWTNELTESDRRKLLLFWSGSSRVPPFGFEDDALNEDHRWAIDKGPAANVCPTASTCDRRMSLPQYSSKEAAFKFLTITLELGCLGYTTV